MHTFYWKCMHFPNLNILRFRRPINIGLSYIYERPKRAVPTIQLKKKILWCLSDYFGSNETGRSLPTRGLAPVAHIPNRWHQQPGTPMVRWEQSAAHPAENPDRRQRAPPPTHTHTRFTYTLLGSVILSWSDVRPRIHRIGMSLFFHTRERPKGKSWCLRLTEWTKVNE